MTATLPAPAEPVTTATALGDARRRRTRRLLFRVGLVPLLLALLLLLKAVSMLYLNSAGRDDYGRTHYAAAAGAFEDTLFANVLERWVAPYDVGTTDYQRGEYADARDRLEEALRLAPRAEECRVRINLALADEALGDAALAETDVVAARALWTTAREVLAAGGCTENDAPGTAATASPSATERQLTAVTVDTRLADKLSGLPTPGREQDTVAPDGGQKSLEARNLKAEQRRRHDEQRREDRDARSHTPPPDDAITPDDPGEQEPPHYEW